MTFSVIIPVYNVLPWLLRCVESVWAQTYRAVEIILVDDGSTDGSSRLCDQLEAQDARIRVIHKTNGGLSDARNAGLLAATGDYVVFLDSDDLWLSPNGLQQIADALARNATDLLLFKRVDLYPCHTSAYSSDECQCSKESDYNVMVVNAAPAQHVFAHLVQMQRFNMSACFQAVKRSFLISNHIFFTVGLLSEDVDFSLRLWQAAQTVQALNIDMYGYWHHHGSITTTYSIRNLRCYDIMFSTWAQSLTDKNDMFALTAKGYLAGLYVSCLYAYGNIAHKHRSEARTILRKHQTLLQYSINRKAKRALSVYRRIGFYGMLCVFSFYGSMKRLIKHKIK
ncbi:MAG: glycosyltransferase [Paludibacter sp.]|nr:glycosyltransferase [Bacteroidales bacterium]MCM1069067.1 glycosyltransferase [Prevotella sp.]MCM1353506.1 glycosyltransferase [Bacteroides sp.]MCM1442667.1 glycosyltransferase [Muribaculum sp.]MCM1481697.1 glycosyltransferase [Paludibacter sp.]